MSPGSKAVTRGLPTTSAGVAVPIDKRFRRSGLKPAKRRLGRLAVRAFALFFVGALVLVVVAWLGAGVVGAKMLAVDQIVVKGNHRLSVSEVQGLLDGLRGESILRADFEHYRKRLLDSPWVAEVTLWRFLPSTVEVRITERLPMAVARLEPQLYLIDTTGVIIDQFGPQYADLDLPIVDGLVAAPATAPGRVDRSRLELLGRVLDALHSNRALSARVSQIDVSLDRDAVVLLDSDSARLHLGQEKFVERLTTYLEIAQTLQSQFTDMDYVDLRFDDRVYVRSGGRMKKLEKP